MSKLDLQERNEHLPRTLISTFMVKNHYKFILKDKQMYTEGRLKNNCYNM